MFISSQRLDVEGRLRRSDLEGFLLIALKKEKQTPPNPRFTRLFFLCCFLLTSSHHSDQTHKISMTVPCGLFATTYILLGQT